MAHRAIPMTAFPRVRTIYIFVRTIYSCVQLREYICVVYVVKEVCGDGINDKLYTINYVSFLSTTFGNTK